jgi:tetratricopeptide (TPR) repeat protein
MSGEFPYPGLRPFERDETDIFFGREEHTDQLLERLEHTHFLAVVGPSGCGKSSLVRTGMLAGLETGLLVSAGAHWRVADMRPGNHPFTSLTEALLLESALGPEYMAHVTSYLTGQTETAAFLAANQHHGMLQAQLRRGPFSIQELLAKVPLPEHTHLLLVVDQFEEIFRYYRQGAEDEAAAFVSLLLASSQHADVYVVLTMRSDFLGDCALFHGLPEAINHGLFLTPRLNREQLRLAIEEPARVFGGELEPALVNRLLNDTGDNPDQLPVLQHALMRMWTIASASPSGGADGGEGMTLTMDHYAQIGGLDAALSQHADEAYHELSPVQQSIAEIMFRSLSERGSERRDTRRPVALAEIATVAQVPWQQVATVVDVFRQEGRSFLTPPVGRALERNSIVDISHESLIRQWKRLQDWTTQETEAAELYQRLEDSACRWEQGHAALWRTPELEAALAWRERAKPTAAWAKRYGQHFELAMCFLDASAAQQQAEQQHAEAARQRELRQTRKQRTVLLLGLIVAIGLALWAYRTQRRAEEATQQAVAARYQADASAKESMESFGQALEFGRKVFDRLNQEKMRKAPVLQPARKELGAIGLQYYQDLVRQRGDAPVVREQVWGLLGIAMHFQGNLEDAIAAYLKQLEIKPDHETTWNNLGLVLDGQGKPEDAIAAYLKQLEIKPDDEWAWNNLGVALDGQGKPEDAIAAYLKQLEIKPDHELAWLNLGNTLNKQGHPDEAAAAYAQGLAVHPYDLFLLGNDMELALVQGDMARFHARMAALAPQVTPQTELSVLLPFFAWLANPAQDWRNVMTAIQELAPEVPITWEFWPVLPIIKGLEVSTQKVAQHFIDFFEGRINRETLKAQLGNP